MHPPGLEMGVRQVQQRGCFRGGVLVALSMTETRNFGADMRPVGDVEIRERRRPHVCRRFAISIEESPAQIGTSEPLEIHGEEGDVGEDIAVTELIVELETIDGPRSLLDAEDVFGQEIAVAVTSSVRVDAFVEEGISTAEVFAGQRRDASRVAVGTTLPSYGRTCAIPSSHRPATASRVVAASIAPPLGAVS